MTLPALLRAFTDNWKLKLLAFTLAILLWVVVSAEEVTSRSIDLPLQVQVTDPEYMLRVETVPREVSVRFAGPRRELIDLSFRRPPIILNILDVNDVQQSFELQSRMVQIPTQLSVSVVDMQPSVIDLQFTRVESRFYTVRVRLSEPLPAGWVLVDSLTVQPGRIRVTGPDSRLAAFDSILTVPVALPLSDTSFTLSVPLDTTALQGLRLSASRVQLTGAVDQMGQRSVSDVPVSVGPGLTVQPDEVEVRLIGPQRSLRSLSTADLRVVISLDSIPQRFPEGGLPVPLRVERLPPGVQAIIEPAAARMLPVRVPLDTVAVPGTVEPADTAARRVP
jgi:YbbR domain-containing protein